MGKILYNFIKYPTPKKGLFSIEKKDGKYILPGGWEKEQEEVLIIGEIDTAFVYQLLPSEQGQWVGNKVIIEKFILPIGIHKSRLICWTSGQLSLF